MNGKTEAQRGSRSFPQSCSYKWGGPGLTLQWRWPALQLHPRLPVVWARAPSSAQALQTAAVPNTLAPACHWTFAYVLPFGDISPSSWSSVLGLTDFLSGRCAKISQCVEILWDVWQMLNPRPQPWRLWSGRPGVGTGTLLQITLVSTRSGTTAVECCIPGYSAHSVWIIALLLCAPFRWGRESILFPLLVSLPGLE